MALPEFTGELDTVWRPVAEEELAAVPERVTRALLDAEEAADPEREPSADPEFVANPVAVPNDSVAAADLEPLLLTEPVAAPDAVTQPDAVVLSDGKGVLLVISPGKNSTLLPISFLLYPWTDISGVRPP